MTRILVTLAAAFVLIGPASAQSQGGTAGDTGVVEPQAYPAPRKADGRPADTPNLRDQLLQGAINVLLQPRPKRKPAEAPPPPVMVIPDPPTVIELPVETPAQVAPEPSPLPASVAVTPAVTPTAAPRPAITPANPAPTPHPDPRAEQPPALEPAAPPPVAEPPQPAPPLAVSPAPAPPPPVIEPADPIPTPAPEPATDKSIWLLLGLLAAIVIAAAVLYLRQVRQIARTRAALSLSPSLDALAGAFSANGLALAGPSLAIRARLDLNEALRG